MGIQAINWNNFNINLLEVNSKINPLMILK